MNDKAFEKKVDRDVDNAKKDLTTLMDDGVTGLNRQYEHLTDNVRKTMAGAVKTVNQSVGHGLSRYNAQIQDVADRFPGSFGKQAARYPWVTVTLSLVFGLLLGILLKPGRQPVA